jgi:hypothetical protein
LDLRRLRFLVAWLTLTFALSWFPPLNAAVYGSEISGIASWGDFGGHVVTRLPRGTSIFVAGPQGGWTGTSWGYGPAKSTGRIVDLDRQVFAAICGSPSKGLCRVTLGY